MNSYEVRLDDMISYLEVRVKAEAFARNRIRERLSPESKDYISQLERLLQRLDPTTQKKLEGILEVAIARESKETEGAK